MITAASTVHTVQATAMIHLGAQSPGIFDWVNDMTSQTQGAIQGLLIVVGLLVGMVIAWRGKNVGSVVMGIVVGGLIAALPVLIAFFAGRAENETTSTTAAGIEMITYAHAAITARA